MLDRIFEFGRPSPPTVIGSTRDRIGSGNAAETALASPWLWLLIILGVGLALRVLLIGRESLWLDEAFSWRLTHFSQRELWTEVLDTHPPLYYSLLRMWLVFGDSEAALRSLSVVFGMLAVLLTYVLGRQIADARIGLFAAAIMATSAAQLEYSQEARSYEMLTAASLAASIGLVGVLQAHEAGRRPRLAICVVYVVGMVVTLYTHSIALLLLGIAGLIGLVDVIRRRTLGSVATWAMLNALVIAGWRHWLLVVWQQSRGGMPQLDWLKPPNLDAVLDGAISLYGQRFVFALQPAIILICIPLALIGAFLYRRSGLPVAYLLAAAFGIPLLEIVISDLGRPVFMTRTVIWLAPLFFILVALAFSRLRLSHGVLATGLFIAIQLIGVKNYEQLAQKDPWRETVQTVAARACPDDVIIVAPYSLMEPPFDYYFERQSVPAQVFGAYLGKHQSPDRRMNPIEFTNFSNPDESLLSAPRVWIFLDERFASDAAPFIARLRSQHALSDHLVMRHSTVDLFALPGSSCPLDGKDGR